MRTIKFDLVSWRRALAFACLVLLPSCTVDPDIVRGPDPLANASRVANVPPTLGAADCDPPSPSQPLRSNTEVRAAANEGTTMWARFPGDPPYPSGEPLEVTWRVNGRHDLHLVLVSDGGAETTVDQPERDRSIRWERPGDAWVSTIEFERPGCWRIHATRGTARSGDLWVEVS